MTPDGHKGVKRVPVAPEWTVGMSKGVKRVWYAGLKGTGCPEVNGSGCFGCLPGKKQDMLQLAEELGINATLNMTVPSIKIAITNSEGYEEEFVKNLYETIIANGKRLEELERAEKMRLEELERAEK
ncbi:hypothetical protein TNCV_1176171 [Trichonephila clavipes]|nr:hypothetical protein TNCV_1176171 [Trichonephila clavipes]